MFLFSAVTLPLLAILYETAELPPFPAGMEKPSWTLLELLTAMVLRLVPVRLVLENRPGMRIAQVVAPVPPLNAVARAILVLVVAVVG